VASAVPDGHRVNQTAAQEIFNQPFDYHHTSQSLIATGTNMNSRRSSNNNHQVKNIQMMMGSIDNSLYPRTSAQRKRSISIEHSREEKKSLNATAQSLSKKRLS